MPCEATESSGCWRAGITAPPALPFARRRGREPVVDDEPERCDRLAVDRAPHGVCTGGGSDAGTSTPLDANSLAAASTRPSSTAALVIIASGQIAIVANVAPAAAAAAPCTLLLPLERRRRCVFSESGRSRCRRPRGFALLPPPEPLISVSVVVPWDNDEEDVDEDMAMEENDDPNRV